MPTGTAANRFLERLAKLEARVENLMTYQKWQMGLLAGILLLAVKTWLVK